MHNVEISVNPKIMLEIVLTLCYHINIPSGTRVDRAVSISPYYPSRKAMRDTARVKVP